MISYRGHYDQQDHYEGVLIISIVVVDGRYVDRIENVLEVEK